MKYVLLAGLLLCKCICFSQVFEGKSQFGETCYLKINSDSTINFVSHFSTGGYVEYKGNITNVRGNIYEVQWDMAFEEWGKWPHGIKAKESFIIGIDPLLDFPGSIGFLQVSFLGKQQIVRQVPETYLRFPYDKNENYKNRFVTIETGHIDPILGKPLIIKAPIEMDVYFGKMDYKETFRIIWESGSVRMINDTPYAFGLMELKQVSH